MQDQVQSLRARTAGKQCKTVLLVVAPPPPPLPLGRCTPAAPPCHLTG